MRFEDYSAPFEGDFFREGRRLLGNQLRTYSALQDRLGRDPSRDGRRAHLRDIREFYGISVSSGIRDLILRAYPLTSWIADDISSLIEGRRVVDVGCCDGFFTVFYALNHPSSQFLGIDISEEALKAAQERAERYQARNIRWALCDAGGRSEAYLTGADTIILQDVLYQIFGSSDHQMERKMLSLLAPFQRQDVIVIIGQESAEVKRYSEEDYERYRLESHDCMTEFDRHCRHDITYEIAVFRRRDKNH